MLANDIFEYIKKHPNTDVVSIANALRVSQSLVSARTTPMAQTGRLARRTVPHPTHPKRKLFQYSIGDPNKPFYPRRADKQPPRSSKRKAEEPAAPAAEPAPEVAAPPPPPPAVAAIDLESGLTQLVGGIAETIADEIMSQLSRRLTDRVTRLTAEIKAGIRTAEDPGLVQAQLASQIADAVAPPRFKLMSVLILGLTPTQVQLISDEFSEQFDLRFWQDQPSELLHHACKNVDLILSCTSKLGHRAIAVLKSRNREVIRIPGGMTQLRNKLTEIYVKLDDEKSGKTQSD